MPEKFMLTPSHGFLGQSQSNIEEAIKKVASLHVRNSNSFRV